MSENFAGTFDFPEWALDLPYAKSLLVDYFGDPESWQSKWSMENNDGVIHLIDYDACYGRFEGIEDNFRLLGIPFDRWSDTYSSKFESETVYFRPELDKLVQSSGNGEFSVPADSIEAILDSPNLKEELMKLLPPKFKKLSEYADYGKEVVNAPPESFSLDGLHKAMERFMDTEEMSASCGPWKISRDYYAAGSKSWKLWNDGKLVACSVLRTGKYPLLPGSKWEIFGSINPICNLTDKNFSDLCDIIHSVNPECRMAPDIKQRIEKNQGIYR